MNTRSIPDANSKHENPFLDPDLAARYEQWYSGPGCQADLLEKRLLQRMLHQLDTVRTILEIGCGTGHFTRWMRSLNYEVVGLDSSPPMLEQARSLNGGDYRQGDALSLPFPDQSFDVGAMITTLEFVSDPECALREAARVSRAGLLLGVINRTSLLARRYRSSGNPLWDSARFYTPIELKGLIRKTAAERLVKVSWRTTLWPIPCVRDLPLPWGGFIGLAANWKSGAT